MPAELRVLDPRAFVRGLGTRPRLDVLRAHAARCEGCPLFHGATQTVFGEGAMARGDRVMLVGEQPGDREDLEGHPFVGPAGRLLDEALTEAGIGRRHVYVTNAVKHFKHEMRGKRRLHKRPHQREIDACRPWLEGEIDALRPKIIVCLGATAAQALLGRSFRVTAQRGEWIASEWAEHVMATVHPSSVLRARTPEERRRQRAQFVADLRRVVPHLDRAARAS